MTTEIVTEAIETLENVLLIAPNPTATTEAAGDMFSKLKFEPIEFVNNLSYMGAGMFSIFVVILVIIGAVYGLNAIFKKK